MIKRRWVYILFILVATATGLASRIWPEHFPQAVQHHLGDSSWALAAYGLFGVVFPRWAVWKKLLIAFGFSALVEVSQLSDCWLLDTIRDTQAGKWLIGTGFLWVDLLRYAIGTGIGAVVDALLFRK